MSHFVWDCTALPCLGPGPTCWDTVLHWFALVLKITLYNNSKTEPFFFFFIPDCEDRKDDYQHQDVVNQNKDILFFIVRVGSNMLQKKNGHSKELLFAVAHVCVTVLAHYSTSSRNCASNNVLGPEIDWWLRLRNSATPSEYFTVIDTVSSAFISLFSSRNTMNERDIFLFLFDSALSHFCRCFCQSKAIVM